MDQQTATIIWCLNRNKQEHIRVMILKLPSTFQLNDMKSTTMQPAGSKISVSHMDTLHEVTWTCRLLAVNELSRNKMVPWSLKENWPPILATETRIHPFDDDSTIHMAKKSRASWKDRIKTGDSVMVGGRPTDIVIPCDSIHRFIDLLLTNFSVMGPTGAGKSTVCSSWFRIFILTYDS